MYVIGCRQQQLVLNRNVTRWKEVLTSTSEEPNPIGNSDPLREVNPLDLSKLRNQVFQTVPLVPLSLAALESRSRRSKSQNGGACPNL